jgi:hypothetical protein
MVLIITSESSGLPAKGSAEITIMLVSLWLKSRSRYLSTVKQSRASCSPHAFCGNPTPRLGTSWLASRKCVCTSMMNSSPLTASFAASGSVVASGGMA